MFSITLKRSAATLAVVAGVLAAAAPANAEPQRVPDRAIGTIEELMEFRKAKAVVVLIGANDYGFAAEAEGTQIGSEG